MTQRSLEVFTTADPARWDEALREAGAFGFYQLAACHKLAEAQDGSRAFMPVFRQDDHIIAFPLLERSIEVPGILDASDGLRDAVSFPGFAGPVASAGIPEAVRQRFIVELQGCFEQKGIVSVYSRLHPLVCPRDILAGYGETVEVGVTVSIDLTPPPDVQFAQYRRKRRRDIALLKQLGLMCERAGMEHLDDLIRIYYDTMDRVRAGRDYYYDRAHFEYLMSELPEIMHLFVCKVNGTVASFSLCAVCNGVIEGYLAGTGGEHLSLSPSTLLYDWIREWGYSAGASAFHMGGGVGAQRDSLYKFKMAFGGREHVYRTWRHVVDPRAYDDLCSRVIQCTGREPEDSYFPAYRSPSLLASAPESSALQEVRP